MYDSSTRTLSMSPRKRGLEQFPESAEEFLLSIKRSTSPLPRPLPLPMHGYTTKTRVGAEYIYDLFLIGYINGLRAFLHKSKAKTTVTGIKRLSTEGWSSALGYAEQALRLARHAAFVASEGHGLQAEAMSVQAIDLLGKSLDAAPQRSRDVGSFMGSWSDDVMLKF